MERLKAYENTGLTPEQIKEIDKLYAEKCAELEKVKLVLFAIIRCQVLSVGLAMRKSMKEISEMAKKQVDEIMRSCDYDAIRETYYE